MSESLPKINLHSVQSGQMPTKNFFWCSSQNCTFASLPCVDGDCAGALRKIDTLFTGEYDTVLVESTEEPKVIDAAAGIVLPPKHMTELDRLAVTVRDIENDCAAVPKGTLKYTPLHKITFNEAFRGLSRECAFSLENWQHFREAQN